MSSGSHRAVDRATCAVLRRRQRRRPRRSRQLNVDLLGAGRVVQRGRSPSSERDTGRQACAVTLKGSGETLGATRRGRSPIPSSTSCSAAPATRSCKRRTQDLAAVYRVAAAGRAAAVGQKARRNQSGVQDRRYLPRLTLGFGYNTELLAKKNGGRAGVLRRISSSRSTRAMSRWRIPMPRGTAYTGSSRRWCRSSARHDAFRLLKGMHRNISQLRSRQAHRSDQGDGARRER